MTGPKFLINMVIRKPISDSYVGEVLSGVLLLGDMRVVPLLQAAWHKISDDARNALAKANSGRPFHAVIEFFLRCLEDGCPEGVYGAVAAAIARLPSTSQEPFVCDIQRVFPAYAAEDAPVQEIQRWTFAEYFELIRPRLEKLIESEPEPKVTPKIIEIWQNAISTKSSSRGRRLTTARPSPISGTRRDANSTKIQFHAEPKLFSTEQLLTIPVTGLLVTGIMNPHGPTLNAVVAVGKMKPGAILPVVQLILNPFKQDLQEIGVLACGRTWRPSSVIPELFELSNGCCPTLLLPLKQLKPESAASLFGQYLKRFCDARKILESVKSFYGNPLNRISKDLMLAAKTIGKPVPNEGNSETIEPLNENDAHEFADLLLADEHSGPELQTLFFFWKGSIENLGIGAMATLSLEEFNVVFRHLCIECRVPELPCGPDSIGDEPVR